MVSLGLLSEYLGASYPLPPVLTSSPLGEQVETPPCGEEAFEQLSTLVACPAPRRRPSNLVQASSSRPAAALDF